MSFLCGRCNEELECDNPTEFPTCCNCDKSYHFQCNTVGETSWRTMGPQRRGAWTCASCKGNSTSRTKSNTSNTQSPSVGRANADGGNADVLFSQRFSKLEDLINKRMDDFQTSLDFIGKQMEDLAVAVKNVEKKNVLLEKRLNTQEAENQELKSRVKHLETMFHQREQKDQATKMEISGFKDTKVDENQFVAKVIQAAGLNEEDIQFRVEKIVKEPMDKKGVKTQTLVVQFRTEATRNDVLAKIKSGKVYNKLGDLVPTKIFFNEYLTSYYKKLMYEAKRVKEEKKYAFLWVKSGKILLKKTKDSKIEALLCNDDLRKM
ncbi:hypothetical protein M8J77_008488 [Diaphorina citri]|nr:hypothetical protein M8J77_008488 [Diaphorina citri]